MKIICIGRNYRAHAQELKNNVPAEPIFFLKPDTALIPGNNILRYPDFTDNIHYETELVLRICRDACNVDSEAAGSCYDAIATGFDFTARDIQKECKEKSLPWEKAKAFDGSAAIGEFHPLDSFRSVENILFHLELNGSTVQKGNSKEMIFGFDFIVSYISGFMTLRKGDFVFTGTPEGVGSVQKKDILTAYLNGKKNLEIQIT